MTTKSLIPARIRKRLSARVKIIRRLHKRSNTNIEKYGLKDKKTVKSRAKWPTS